MKVFASPFVPNSPETPKSHSLTWPDRLSRMLEGLISGYGQQPLANPRRLELTSVNNLPAVEVGETVQHTFRYLPKHLLSSPSAKLLDFAIDRVETATFAEFHCN